MAGTNRTIEEWREHLMDRGYSGDKIDDILADWETERDYLRRMIDNLDPTK